MNDYTWNLDEDYIAHGTAHYSEHWTKEQQNAYNHWYYQHNKEKWANSAEQKASRKARINYGNARKWRRQRENEYGSAISNTKAALKRFVPGGEKGSIKDVGSSLFRQAKAGQNLIKSKKVEKKAHKTFDTAIKAKGAAIEKDKNSEKSKRAFKLDMLSKSAKKSANNGLKYIDNFFKRGGAHAIDDIYKR